MWQAAVIMAGHDAFHFAFLTGPLSSPILRTQSASVACGPVTNVPLTFVPYQPDSTPRRVASGVPTCRCRSSCIVDPLFSIDWLRDATATCCRSNKSLKFLPSPIASIENNARRVGNNFLLRLCCRSEFRRGRAPDTARSLSAHFGKALDRSGRHSASTDSNAQRTMRQAWVDFQSCMSLCAMSLSAVSARAS
jgi:hypothetical protein